MAVKHRKDRTHKHRDKRPGVQLVMHHPDLPMQHPEDDSYGWSDWRRWPSPSHSNRNWWFRFDTIARQMQTVEASPERPYADRIRHQNMYIELHRIEVSRHDLVSVPGNDAAFHTRLVQLSTSYILVALGRDQMRYEEKKWRNRFVHKAMCLAPKALSIQMMWVFYALAKRITTAEDGRSVGDTEDVVRLICSAVMQNEAHLKRLELEPSSFERYCSLE